MMQYFRSVAVLFISLLAACNTGPGPQLSVSPSAPQTVVAAGNPLSFSATLLNSSATVGWELAPNLGQLSATSGTQTSYSPPATVGSATVVTLTARAGSLSQAVTINVMPQAGADTTPPVISLQASSNTVTTAGELILSATASDNVGVARVEFFEGSSSLGVDIAVPFSLSIALTSANNGVRVYSARAIDAAGNSTISNTVSLNINIPSTTKADVNQSIAATPTWANFSPRLVDRNDTNGAATSVTEAIGSVTYSCGVTPYSITRTPEQIVTLNPDSNILWPGALVQGRSYTSGLGGLQELAIRERSDLPLTFRDLNFANNSVVVPNPTNANVNAAVGRVLQAAQSAGVIPAARTSFTRADAYSVQQMALQIGASANFLFGSASSQLNFTTRANQRTISAFFVQRAFTVEMNNPSSPSELFSDSFTQAKLDEQVNAGNLGPTNPPVYVASVTYGRILLFTLTAEATSSELDATISAMGGFAGVGGSVSLTARQRQILQNSTVRFVAIGGSAASAESIIKSGDLRSYFTTTAPVTTYVPISYQVRSLKDGSPALVSETSNYNLKNCALVPASIPVSSLRVTMQAGTDAFDCTADGTRSFGSFNTTSGRTTETLIIRCLEAGQSVTVDIPMPPGIKLGDLTAFNLRVLSRNCFGCTGDRPILQALSVQLENEFTSGPRLLLDFRDSFQIQQDIFERSFALTNTR